MIKVEICEFVSDVSLFESFKKYTKNREILFTDYKEFGDAIIHLLSSKELYGTSKDVNNDIGIFEIDLYNKDNNKYAGSITYMTEEKEPLKIY